MCDFLCYELDKIWYQLMQPGISRNAGERRHPVLIVVFVKQCATDPLKVPLEFHREDMSHQRLESNVVIAAHSGQGGIRVWTFGCELLIPRLGCRGILRYGRLDTLDGEPVSFEALVKHEKLDLTYL